MFTMTQTGLCVVLVQVLIKNNEALINLDIVLLVYLLASSMKSLAVVIATLSHVAILCISALSSCLHGHPPYLVGRRGLVHLHTAFLPATPLSIALPVAAILRSLPPSCPPIEAVRCALVYQHGLDCLYTTSLPAGPLYPLWP